MNTQRFVMLGLMASALSAQAQTQEQATSGPVLAKPAAATTGASAGTSTVRSDAQQDPMVTHLLRGFKDVTTFPTGTAFIGYSGAEPQSGQRITLYYDASTKVVIYGVGFNLQTNKQLGPPIALGGKQLDTPGMQDEMEQDSKKKVLGLIRNIRFVELKGVKADGRTLYAFVEPACGYCAAAYREITPLLANSQHPLSRMTIRWVPAAYKPAHFAQVAFALDPASGSAVDRGNAIFGGTSTTASAAGAAAAKANLAGFQAAGIQGTPTFVLEQGQGKGNKATVGYSGVEALTLWLQ